MKTIYLRGAAALLLSGASALAFAQEAGESLCVAPGITVLTDPADDVTVSDTLPAGLPIDSADLLSIQVAQPAQADGVVRLLFTLKVASLAALPPSSKWYTSFKSPNGNFYGVRMVTNEMRAVSFQSYSVAGSLDTGEGGASDGRFAEAPKPAEAESSFSADGVISIVVKAADIGLGKPGDVTQFNAGTVLRLSPADMDVLAGVLDGAPDDLSRRGSLTTTANEECKSAAKSTPAPASAQFAGALGFALLLPLVFFGAYRRAHRG